MNMNRNATFKQSEAERQNPPTATSGVEALEAVYWACVTGEVGYGDYDSETSLHDKLELIDAAIAGKADLAHMHTASNVTGLPMVAQTGDYADLLNAPNLAPIATSGSYNDLSDKPIIPTVPTSLPANGGNADTVDGKHASEFATATHIHEDYASNIHAHAISDITGLSGELDGKANAVHTHNYAASAHTHTLADVSETNEKKIMTAEERTKLGGIAAGANNYTHPATHAASMITGLSTVATSGSYDDLSDKPTSMAPTAHTHAQSDVTGLTAALSGKANATHTHGQSDVTGLADALEAKADATHTHSGYATTSHTHSGYAASNHTHNYAASNHTHDYAASDHVHDEYFPVAGGTINGNTNVAGILRVNGQQSFYYQTSTNSQTVGTNNATGGTTICCGSSADVAINGANTKVPNLIPRGTNTYYCGNANFRWKGIYSAAAVNVSSDERLKRNIVPMDAETLARFVEGLNVVSYNYKDDEETAKARIGLIAQDVRKANADIAEYFVNEESDGMLSLAPADFVFPLIAAVQQLSARVRELEEKVK